MNNEIENKPNTSIVKLENREGKYQVKTFTVSIKPQHLWFMRKNMQTSKYEYGIVASFFLFVSQEMGVKWQSSHDPRDYQNRQDPNRKEWEARAQYYSRSGELVEDICTVTMDIMALRAKLRANWKKTIWHEDTQRSETVDEAKNYFEVDPKTRATYFNLPKEAELEIYQKILNMLDHIEKKLETITKRRIMQNAISEIPRNISLEFPPDKITKQPIIPEGKELNLHYKISVYKPVFSAQELQNIKTKTTKELYELNDTEVNQVEDVITETADEQGLMEEPAKVETPKAETTKTEVQKKEDPKPKPEEKANPAEKQKSIFPESKSTGPKCSKCKSDAEYAEGKSKKTGKPWKGYRCINPQCKNMDFINS